ncbi:MULTISPECIES: hypothetical protein [unclassified Nocardia]|uniref:hypothetical protein n=1 Tax=unclassified Nocardia TaxID=2637762 RepID=UPI0033BB7C11
MTGGLVLAVAIPLAVLVGVVLWPEPIPKDRTVDAIRARIEQEAQHPNGRRTARPPW